MPQEAELRCNAQPVGICPVRGHKLQVGWGECVKLLASNSPAISPLIPQIKIPIFS